MVHRSWAAPPFQVAQLAARRSAVPAAPPCQLAARRSSVPYVCQEAPKGLLGIKGGRGIYELWVMFWFRTPPCGPPPPSRSPPWGSPPPIPYRSILLPLGARSGSPCAGRCTQSPAASEEQHCHEDGDLMAAWFLDVWQDSIDRSIDLSTLGIVSRR